MQWSIQQCGVAQRGERVIENLAQWEDLWHAMGQAAPEADLRGSFAVAVFLGSKNTGGYNVRFLDPVADPVAKTLTVRYQETKPKGMAIQVLTTPCAIRLFPKSALSVRVEAAP